MSIDGAFTGDIGVGWGQPPSPGGARGHSPAKGVVPLLAVGAEGAPAGPRQAMKGWWSQVSANVSLTAWSVMIKWYRRWFPTVPGRRRPTSRMAAGPPRKWAGQKGRTGFAGVELGQNFVHKIL